MNKTILTKMARLIYERVEIDRQLAVLSTHLSMGANATIGDSTTIRVTAEYMPDMTLLLELAGSLPTDLDPVYYTPKLNERIARHLHSNEPELWAKIAPAITINKRIELKELK